MKHLNFLSLLALLAFFSCQPAPQKFNYPETKKGDVVDAFELIGHSSVVPDLLPVVKTRKGKFDSHLIEPGPPAILTERGILLIYNSKNSGEFGDPKLAPKTYSGGQVLFDKNDPSKQINRLDSNFFQPDKSYEIEGQINQVCFLEGLVHFRGKWFMYYGTADSKIAVAVKE